MMTAKTESLRICTSAEMREIDRVAEQEYGIEPSILMENAGRSASQILLENYPTAGMDTEILVFAGKGNNAGDAFVIARRLLGLGRRVRVFYVDAGFSYPPAVEKNFQILKKLQAKLVPVENVQAVEAFLAQASGPFTIIDGLLGTGLKGPLEGLIYDLVELINKMSAAGSAREILALDIPTGVSGDTGAVQGAAIEADLTVSFGFPKLGHFLPPGAPKRGNLVNVDISLPVRFRREGDKHLLMPSVVSGWLHERDRYGHKNAFGHTLLVGGTKGRLGAIDMASRAAHRMGTGLVTAATWEDSIDLLMAKIPSETMAFPLIFEGKEFDAYVQNLANYSSVVVGPGLGLRKEGRRLLEELLTRYRGPVVLDADALNLIADGNLFDLLVSRRAPTVLTPHPGEMARLLGVSKDEVMADVMGALQRAVEKTCSIVLLKGAATLVQSPDSRVYLNHYPNDGMATAGSGDVLAGMIGGLLGQRMDPFQATLLGIYLHSLAGDLAAQVHGHRSMTAPDIIENISHAFQKLKTHTEPPFPYPSRAKLL